MVCPTLDQENLSVDQRFGEFFSRHLINALDGSACDTHLFCAFLLRKAFEINESYGFILVYGHSDEVISVCP